MKPEIIIVDEKDRIIGFKDRNAIDEKDIYRVSALWITDSEGNILLAKRHRNKINNPGKWGPAVSGTVERDESYEQNIIKETEEELGLKNVFMKVGPKMEIEGNHRHFTQWYYLNSDMPTSKFDIQKEEVEEVKWFSREEMKEKLKSRPEEFIPKMEDYFEMFDHQ